MRDLLRNTIAPISSLLIIMLGTSFFNTFVSIRVSEDGWNNFTTGLVYSAYYAGMMTGAVYMERVIRRTGYIRAFSLFASIISTAIILQSFTSSPFTWILFRFFTGLATAGLFIVIESWLLLLSSPNTRGSVLAIYMVTLYSAQSLGQFILNFVEVKEITSFNVTILFCSLSIVPVCLMKANAPSLHQSEYVNIFYILKKTPLGFIGNLAAGLIVGSFYALGPVFAKETGFEMWQITLIMAITIFGGMALQWPIGRFSDLIDRRKVIILVSFVLMSISLTLFFFESLPFYLLLILLFLFGGFSFTILASSISLSVSPCIGLTTTTIFLYRAFLLIIISAIYKNFSGELTLAPPNFIIRIFIFFISKKIIKFLI